MSRKNCLTKNQTRAEPFRITGINPTKRRSQEEISRPCADHASPPIDDRLKRAGAQAGGAGRKSESELHHLSAAQRKPFRLSAKNESGARFTSRCLQRHANVRADRFESR